METQFVIISRPNSFFSSLIGSVLLPHFSISSFQAFARLCFVFPTADANAKGNVQKWMEKFFFSLPPSFPTKRRVVNVRNEMIYLFLCLGSQGSSEAEFNS